MDTRINWLRNRKQRCTALFDNTSDARELMATLANVNRLKILCCLLEGERSVHEIILFTKLRQPTVSQHLGLLRDKSVVDTRRDGKAMHYSLTHFPTRVFLESLDELFELRVLTRIHQA